MWTWGDIDRTFAALAQHRQWMDNLFADLEGGSPTAGAAVGWPRANLHDLGTSLRLQVEVPGLAEKDLDIHATADGLTLAGERKADAPEGYSVHRQERGSFRFSRSFTFPCRVDLEKVTARVKNGLLTIELAKAPEAQPRQITVKAS